jgi:hypothetical protein
MTAQISGGGDDEPCRVVTQPLLLGASGTVCEARVWKFATLNALELVSW